MGTVHIPERVLTVRIRHYGSFVAPIFLLAVLGGCAAAAPEEAPAASSTPATTADPAVVATLQFSGSNVQSLSADGDQIAVAAFEEGTDVVVGFITDTLGVDPQSTDIGEECAGAQTLLQWDGLTINDWADTERFTIGFDVATVDGVRLEVTGGFSPGDDVSAFIATLPAEDSNLVATEGFHSFDTVSYATDGAYSSPVGAMGMVYDGVTLATVLTPAQFSSFCC